MLQQKTLFAAAKTQSSQNKVKIKDARWQLSRKKDKWWESVEDTFNFIWIFCPGRLISTCLHHQLKINWREKIRAYNSAQQIVPFWLSLMASYHCWFPHSSGTQFLTWSLKYHCLPSKLLSFWNYILLEKWLKGKKTFTELSFYPSHQYLTNGQSIVYNISPPIFLDQEGLLAFLKSGH